MWGFDSRQPVGLVAVGIGLATIGACTSGLGMNLMKSSKQLERDRPWWKRPRLLVGISLACWVNSILDTVAFALAPLSIIAPLGGLTIVASVLLARLGCAGKREDVTTLQWVCIWIVVSGVAVIDIYGPRPEPVLNTTYVLDRYHESGWITYQLATLVVVASTYVGIYMGKLGGPDLETTIATAVSGGMASGITQNLMKLLATVAAAFMLTGELPFGHPDFYCAIAELIVVAVLLLHLLNMCIGSAAMSLATPLYLVCVITFTITASCAFYGDLDVVTRFELLMFSIGVAMVLGGLLVLILKRDTSRDQRLLATKEPRTEKAPVPSAQPSEVLPADADGIVDIALGDPDPEL